MANPAAHTIQNIPPNALADIQTSIMNQVIDQINGLNRNQVFFDANGNATMQLSSSGNSYTGLKINDSNGVGLALFGKYPDGSTALKVAQAGVEVTTASDDKLVFNSNQNVFKIVRSSSTTLTIPFSTPPNTAAGTYTTTVAHNLGYVPAVIAYVSPPGFIGGAQTIMPWVFPVTTPTAGTVFLQASFTVDANNIIFTVFQRSGTDYSPDAPTYTFKYYLLQETAK